jgi:hypothetical protein
MAVEQFGENTFGQPPAPFGYSPPEAHPMHSAGLGMTGTIPSIDSMTHHQIPQFPVINRGPVLDGEVQDQVEDGDTDDMKAEDTYSNSVRTYHPTCYFVFLLIANLASLRSTMRPCWLWSLSRPSR